MTAKKPLNPDLKRQFTEQGNLSARSGRYRTAADAWKADKAKLEKLIEGKGLVRWELIVLGDAYSAGFASGVSSEDQRPREVLMAREFPHRAEAYILAKGFGCKIDYEKSGRYWKVNINAPEGKMFRGGETSLVTTWSTPPTDQFWQIVCHDIRANGPHIIDFD